MQNKTELKDIKYVKEELRLGSPHKKLIKGDTGNHTFTMFGTTKKFFLRDVTVDLETNASTILASKLARMISKDHFASEKWLPNGKTVSLALPENAFPHPRISAIGLCIEKYDSSNSEDIKNKEEALSKLWPKFNQCIQQSYIRGLGIIDEACEFIGESDPNMENLMFLGEHFDANTIAIKFDFNGCGLNWNPSSVEYLKYLPGNRHTYGNAIYSSEKPTKYIEERALTRLKIALISDQLIESLLKSYCPKEFREKYAILIKSNRDIATEALSSQQYGLDNLNEHLMEYIDDCCNELNQYARKHFPDQLKEINHSLDKRKELIKQKLGDNKEFDFYCF